METNKLWPTTINQMNPLCTQGTLSLKKKVDSVTVQKKKSLMGNYREDEKRLDLLKTGRDQAWKDWYDEMREPFRLFFIKYGAIEPETALSLFHDAMVIFHANVREQKLEAPLKSTLRTYLFGIGKILLKKQGIQLENVIDGEIPEIPIQPNVETTAEQQENASLVRDLLNKLGEPCKSLLQLIYIKGYAMEAVAEELDIPSAGAVRKRKFDCLKKLRALMK